jgi:acetyl esterase/lipase
MKKMNYSQQSFQNRILALLLKIFLKPKFAKFAAAANPEERMQHILALRKLTEKYAQIPVKANISDVSIGQLSGKWVEAAKKNTQRIILYLHGGAFVFGSSRTYLDFGYNLAKACQAKVLIIDYQLAPEHLFPAALNDALTAYQWLCASGIDPANIIIAGDFAGGGLTLATLVALRNRNIPLPRAAICLSPWADLANTGESRVKNQSSDPYLVLPQKINYLGNINLFDPLLSPLYADLKHLPNLFIQVSGREILLDDSLRLAEKAEQARVSVTIEVWNHMPHVWQLFSNFLPEGRQAIQHIGNFVDVIFNESHQTY